MARFALPILLSLFSAVASASLMFDNTALLKRIEAGAVASGSDRLIVIEDGKVLLNTDFGRPAKVQSVQSISKSVCAIAIGVLLDRGQIRSVDEPMSTWIPSWRSHPAKSKITLRMILSHTSGLPNDTELGKAADRIEFAINRELVAAPGEKFIYSNVGSALFQHVIASASGMSVEAFVDQVLFVPLGIMKRSWAKDERGHEGTGGGLSMVSTDLVKIGEMMLGGGIFDGETVLSRASHDLIVTKSQGLEDYGLLWWLKLPQNQDSKRFRVHVAAGWGGQYIVVFPEKKLIAVRTRDPETISEANEAKQSFGEFVDLVSQWR